MVERIARSPSWQLIDPVSAPQAIRHAVSGVIRAHGIDDVRVWAGTLAAAAVVMHDINAASTSCARPALEVADAALRVARARGISVDEAIRVVRDDCPFDVHDTGWCPRVGPTPWTTDDDNAAREDIRDAQRKDGSR